MVAVVALTTAGCNSAECKKASENRKIERLLSKMTLEEKIGMLHANRMFSSTGVARLGIPDVWYADGPHGVRYESVDNGWTSLNWENDACTNMPALSALAATWNRELALQCGEVIGAESKARGKHVQLAPGVNITRSVLNGRTWEYFSEDPYITAELAVPYIQGVQSKGVAACVKHFALNSQAIDQYWISSQTDERSLREIYLPAFDAAINRAGAMALMPAYNKIDGLWCSENKYMIDTLLRGEWGFDGVVVSDWNGIHNTVSTATTGTDVEMGTAIKENGLYAFHNYYFSNPLLEKVKDGTVSEEYVDAKVRNILRMLLRLDAIGGKPYDTLGMGAKLATPQHTAVARKIAEESIVLLKNDNNVLPLNPQQYKKVAVIGVNANTKFSLGGGSPKVKAKYEVTVLEGLRNRLGDDVEINFAPGYKLLNRQFVPAKHHFTNEFDRDFPELAAEAVEVAKEAELVIFVGGLSHEHGMDCEGYDRPNMKLPYRQDELIAKVKKANPNTVVVLMAGSPVEMGEWYDTTDAVLQCSFLGTEGGNALARVLYGDVNPSGKLANTWSVRLEDMPDIKFGEYPGNGKEVHFNEGLLVGYRYFDTYDVKPMFEFGYGLSYTTFAYSDLEIAPVWNGSEEEFEVAFTITNTGDREGSEAAQIYVHQNESSVMRPEKELKGFEKVTLAAGESKRVQTTLSRRALQWWNAEKDCWIDEAGKFTLLVGASSRDIRLTGEFELVK
ncbi:MAG: glycoside hydrolase family 3 C-terminal domain-containing protein [Tidjanibacter sp.]|nr:glycoside hydrolase family 3 C-terminal domain-containing protein [Tidjanibacter sp.]